MWKAARSDFARYRSANRAAADLGRKLAALASESKVLSLTEERAGELSAMIERARDALVRARPDGRWTRSAMVERVREGLEARGSPVKTPAPCGLNREFFRYARRAHRFPGSTS